nr:PREDICTED: uncharacterized protein LOC105671682 [Linepithema humile]
MFLYSDVCEYKKSSISVCAVCSETLHKMNVTVIPFFLAANVIVNDTSEWVFGPEYFYNLNLNTTYVNVPENFSMPNEVRLFMTMKCRPKIPNRLLCLILNSTYTDSYRGLLQSLTRTTSFPSFEIKYNKRGIESLLINSTFVNANEGKFNVIKRIANQLNLGVNLKRNRDTSRFKGVENTSMGICTTRYEISRNESETEPVKENIDFTLFVLPMTDAKPGTTVSIEKYRTRCINSPRRLYSRVLKMERFFSKMQIGDGFESFSKLDGKLRTYSTHSNETFLLPFNDVMHLNLISIKPAQNDIPNIDSGKLYELNINTAPDQESYELYE